MKIHKCIVLVLITTLLFMFCTKEFAMANEGSPRMAETFSVLNGNNENANVTYETVGGIVEKSVNNVSISGNNSNTDDNNNNVIKNNIGTEHGTSIIMLQYLRKPKEGTSLLNELLFLPQEFYNNAILEEGYTIYGICHSGFNVAIEDENENSSGNHSRSTENRGDGGGRDYDYDSDDNDNDSHGNAERAVDYNVPAKDGGHKVKGGGATGDDVAVGNEFEGIIKFQNDKLTFQYGMIKQNKMPDCKTRHKFDLFEKHEFESLCHSKLYVIGLNISGNIITFAESCFDFIKNKVHFVRYILKAIDPVPSNYIMPDSKDQSTELKLQDWNFKDRKMGRFKRNVNNSNSGYKYQKFKRDVKHIFLLNETLIRRKKALYIIFNSTIEKNPYRRTFLPEAYFQPLSSTIEETLRKNIGFQVDFLKFSRANLFPSNIFEPYISELFKNITFLQSFIGWDNLVYGNWKTLNDILKLRVEDLADRHLVYNIYTGTSHIAEAVIPDSYDLKELGIKEYGKLKPIPKYVWMYIYSKQTNENFVIIGINSPYHPFFQNADIFFCTDMCDKIVWMKPIETLRKLNSFGRIFCCERRHAETVLHGFPLRASMMSAETGVPNIHQRK